ncbi:FAD-dependent monooxygenase [Saccharothrix sp. BKS2]|uniref:NAD(P)/FAD-dependent oxidoreductase n=1 Tax=Saccharothrix sp. BKS2 TaxID=3064400 RepID=UPI0039EA3022
MYDAVVVGARCAGAATALLLARRGYRVLLLDRARFPSDTMSTLYIHQPGVARLARWGVLDAITASGAPRLDTVTYAVGDVRLSSRAPAFEGVDSAYGPRRHVLDQALVDAAVAAGAEFSDSSSVRGLLTDGDAVTGVRFRAPSGAEVAAPAHLVVGADGMRSAVADLVGAPTEVEDPRLSCVYYSLWTGIDTGFGFHERTGRWIATIPTHGGATVLATYFPQDRFDEVRLDPRAAHLDALATTAGEVFEQLAGGEQVGRLVGTGDQRNFFRRAAGRGWALVGDAGHHRDTITAQGISNAFLQAELLTEALGDGLRDPGARAAGLRAWAARRDEELVESYHGTLQLARLEVTGARLEMLRAIAADPDLTTGYFAVVAGLMPMEDLLTEELLDFI